MLNTEQMATLYPKFANGTRKNLAALVFTIQVKVGQLVFQVETPPSNSFVVITNEVQYEEALQILIRPSFPKQGLAWVEFANLLQKHFVISTRQELQAPKRCLSLEELDYLHSVFFSRKPGILVSEFDNFWKWFSPALHKLRHQRPLAQLYQAGLIYGFASREGVNKLLETENWGACVLRFSEKNPGSFAVGYVTSTEERIRHYLVKEEDISGKKTLGETPTLLEMPEKELTELTDPTWSKS
eukprot:TRINITY_DN6781_c0_g1_i2.p1 TRINITY_DN6781_c0_g1~~TRINITY_DN6781_c0_g1_i2.p1  ORF type:complete len:242 (-),score=84.49 TRINITY_DN6781_c0_g1_i2:24-749(-)